MSTTTMNTKRFRTLSLLQLLLFYAHTWSTHAQSIIEDTIGVELPDAPLIDKGKDDLMTLCQSFPAYQGWFRFLENRAEAYFLAQDGFLYFEYYFPQFMFTAIAVSNQTNNGSNTGCLECYNYTDPDRDVQACRSECVGGNEFVITALGDTAINLINSWYKWEVDIVDSGDESDPAQFTIYRWRGNGTILAEPGFLELVIINGLPYVHGSWARYWNNSDGDTWHKPRTDKEPFCITTVSSAPGNPFHSSVGEGPVVNINSFVRKELTEVHCVDVSQTCSHYTVDPTRSPTSEPTVNPTTVPTTAPTRNILPPTDVEIPSDVCAWANMTFIVVVDASESIAGTDWEISKQWILKIFEDADLTMKRQEAEWRAQGYDITLCMRTALLLFSSSVETVWDLESHGECYNVTTGRDAMVDVKRPHNPLDTIHGTHTKDALQEAVDLTRAQRRPDERTIVLLLTDGLPQAIQGDESQNPCFVSPNPLAQAYSSNDQNIELIIVAIGVYDGSNLGILPSAFACFNDKTYITFGDIIDLPEYTTDVNNEFFAAFCRVKTYGCDIPLYPHQPESTEALYNASLVNLTMDGTISSFLVTFETFAQYLSEDETSVFIWPNLVSILAESFCRTDNITLSAKLWLWTDDGTIDPQPIVSKNKAYVRFFETDLDNFHANWYNFSMVTEADSYLRRGRFYTLEIVIEDYGDCQYSDLQFLAQAPELNNGIVYETGKFQNMFMVLKDNDNDMAWFPDVLSSTSLPVDADDVWPFITFCMNEWAVPPTASPTDSPTVAPTDIPTESPTVNPTRSPSPAPTDVPTGNPTAAPTMEFCDPREYPAPLDIVFIVDTVCGLSTEQCAQQQEYVSDLMQAVKNDINRVSYIECTDDTLSSQVVIALDDDKFNDVPDNPPNSKTLTQLYNTVRDARGCQLNAAIHKVAVPYKLHCLNLAVDQMDLGDYTRFKKVVYVSNCEEDVQGKDAFDATSICARDDLNDIGGRIDVIACNVGVNEFNIHRDELACITSSDRIFSYDEVDELAGNMGQFIDIKEEICEPPTAVPTLSPTLQPSTIPTSNPTAQPTRVPSDQPTDSPTSIPTEQPTEVPTFSPTSAPTHSPLHGTVCDWPEPTDVVFVVDETCGLSGEDIRHQNEFLANLIQRIKTDALTPRLGFIGCSSSVDVVFDVTTSVYNDAFFQLNADDIKAMSLEIRDRTFDADGGGPHRKDCILAAMHSFGESNTRNKKIVVLSNCEETAASDTCSLKDNELDDYEGHIDFILINVGGETPLDLNTCLDEDPNRLFYYLSSEQLNPFVGQSEVLTVEICEAPTASPTAQPTKLPTSVPTNAPTNNPTTNNPTRAPSPQPTAVPTKLPTLSPTGLPTTSPSSAPTTSPTHSPHQYPTRSPSPAPTTSPTASPLTPTHVPTRPPTPLECPAPPDFIPPDSEGAIACQPTETEWGISFTNWAYDDKHDATYVRYEVCVSRAVPFQACGNATQPSCLAGIFIQIPCLCEVCLPEVTYHMEPAGKASIAFEGWLWFESISAGECQNFDVVIRGHAQMHEGVYKLFGMDGRYEVGVIETPNPCFFNADNPFGDDDDDKQKNDTNTDAPVDDSPPNKCGSRSMEFAEKHCDFLCDYNVSEFSGEFVNRIYNEERDETIFTYQISTDSEDHGCHPNDEPITLDFFFVRVGCDCEPMSSSFLTSITKDMQPYGTVGDVYWLWHDIQVRPGQSLLVNLTLVGDVSYSVGDLTFAGDSPTGYSYCSNDWSHDGVPNPCNDRCLYGQWTDWQDWGSCSKRCGGGKRYRVRDCLSVCDGETPVDNCMGDSHSYVPCNTHQCDEDDPSDKPTSDSTDRSKTWRR